ncbi:hypothetical protein LINGRAHAP2_LOCUS4013, partial [Linum grandiflorum]
MDLEKSRLTMTNGLMRTSKRLDHLKVDCPRLRRENERALQAVWGGSEDDDDSSDGEVIAAQAHMAIAETVKNTTE